MVGGEDFGGQEEPELTGARLHLRAWLPASLSGRELPGACGSDLSVSLVPQRRPWFCRSSLKLHELYVTVCLGNVGGWVQGMGA